MEQPISALLLSNFVDKNERTYKFETHRMIIEGNRDVGGSGCGDSGGGGSDGEGVEERGVQKHDPSRIFACRLVENPDPKEAP
ncbi:hypothetical protein HZH66_000115 [Vespula vulgaris]|uniref:Uncharacterized protein n=1 Tax=Vespula vulgaris TaxID=7454 RepID=A0A834KNI8_VESVU|nr:hypothetical protein HZH66_000115 [Vespula vulgaris]